MFSSNWFSSFIDHQHLQKEFIDHLDFLHENSHQGNNNSEANTFSWKWSAFPSHTQISRTF